MNRLMKISTVLGLVGLPVAILTALAGGAPSVVLLGFVMLALGFMGAVIGVAAAIGKQHA